MLDVYYDGQCPLCIRSAALLGRLDLWGHLRFVDLEQPDVVMPDGVSIEDLRRELHVVSANGASVGGFFAFRSIARALPALWLLVPLLYLPGARAIGPLAYRRVAKQRPRLESCADVACERHSRI